MQYLENEVTKILETKPQTNIFIIKDWADNRLFPGLEFSDFEEAWGFIYEAIPDEESWQDIYVVEV